MGIDNNLIDFRFIPPEEPKPEPKPKKTSFSMEDLGLVINKTVRAAQDTQEAMRNGVILEKSVMLTKEKVEKNRKLIERYIAMWTVYPDLYLDFIKPVESTFRFAFYQRVFLRAIMRYQIVYCTAPRGFSKSFTTILAIYLLCIFRPKFKTFICAPGKEQGAKIGDEKIHEIWELFPLLKKEIIGDGNFGKDYVKLKFRNKSELDIVGALATTRGGRRNGGLIDEIRDHDGETLNEVVLPLLVVERRTGAGLVNPNEPQACQFYMTSASYKSSYAYEKLIENLGDMIIDPTTTFVFGCDYRLPVKEGILSKNYLQQMRLSPTYSDESFARESMGIWTGGSSDAWFNYDKLTKHRVLVNPETHEKIKVGEKAFYLFSVDVARNGVQSVLTIFKVHTKNTGYYASVVNIIVLGRTPETKHFEMQAIEIKRYIEAFRPVEVVIDGNGLGVGLLDFMSKEQITSRGTYPAYGVFNDDDYKRTQPKGCIPLIFLLRATNALNSKIHGNCFYKINSGKVFFLTKEQEIKTKLMASKVGQRMTLEERTARLMPHEMTTRLFEEMCNLKMKANGLDINLEPINTNVMKDKFSSLEYGLWRIAELEAVAMKKKSRKFGDRKYAFYSQGS